MSSLKQAIDDLASEYAPCLVIACGLGSPSPEGRLTNVLAARGETPDKDLDELITALAGLKQSYLKMCEGYADAAGIPEQELHNSINERMNETRLRD